MSAKLQATHLFDDSGVFFYSDREKSFQVLSVLSTSWMCVCVATPGEVAPL